MIDSISVYKTYVVKFIVFLTLLNCLGFVKIVEEKKCTIYVFLLWRNQTGLTTFRNSKS